MTILKNRKWLMLVSNQHLIGLTGSLSEARLEKNELFIACLYALGMNYAGLLK